MQSVFLKWEDMEYVEESEEEDPVENEIDVFFMDGNIPCFVSCKAGRISANPMLHALYELEALSTKFAGKKYVRKILVTSAGKLEGVHLERAREFGIELRYLNEDGVLEEYG